MVGAGFLDDRLVEARIEVGADGLDRLDAALAQQLQHLAMNQLDAFAERVGVAAGRRLQRALEVVDDRQQLGQRARPSAHSACSRRSRSTRLR